MKAIVYQGSHLVVVVAALVFLVGSAPGAPASAASKSFLTLQFGRTQLALAGPGCSASPGAVPLGSVVRQMWRLGYAGTGAVALDITGQGWSSCRGRIRYAGWRTLQRWHHRYRFHLISAGRHYTDVRRLRPSEQRADICGSLAAFRRHGFRAAWGMFAYPDDHSDSRVQQHVTAGCFAFGRTYSHDVNTRPGLRSPWFQRTYSIDGGACNLTGLDCYRIVTPVWPAHYTSPRLLASLMRPSVGQWRVVQMYRFVRGRRMSGAIRWNCRGPNWRGHWTTRIELYCAKDYLSAVRSIPSTVRVVSPTAVARAWGRAPVLP